MVHDFVIIHTKKTASLSFKEDGKSRRIIFDKKTKPYEIFWSLTMSNSTDYNQSDLFYRIAINKMRDIGYKFIANKNNKSIFRPVK